MLRGTHVTLRSFEREDVKRQHELMRNVDLVLPAYASWEPQSLAAHEKWFDKHAENEDQQTKFAIEVGDTFVGFINLHPWSVNRRAGTAMFGMAILNPDYVGKGYGREALRLFLDWAFRIQNFRRIGLITWADNQRAIHCYHACGFVEEGREREAEYVNGQYADVITMGLLRREWEAQRTEHGEEASAHR
ncbi:MAG: GNAT family N-acetyltransferase [Ktedonobacterales bacterium]